MLNFNGSVAKLIVGLVAIWIREIEKYSHKDATV